MNRPHYTEAELRADLPEDTMIVGSGRTELTDVRGAPSMFLIFKDPAKRQEFRRKYHGAWVTFAELSAVLSYDMDWKDVNGWGLHLSQWAAINNQLGRMTGPELVSLCPIDPARGDLCGFARVYHRASDDSTSIYAGHHYFSRAVFDARDCLADEDVDAAWVRPVYRKGRVLGAVVWSQGAAREVPA